MKLIQGAVKSLLHLELIFLWHAGYCDESECPECLEWLVEAKIL